MKGSASDPEVGRDKYLGALMSLSTIGIALLDADGRVLASNRKAQVILPRISQRPSPLIQTLFPNPHELVRILGTQNGGRTVLESSDGSETKSIEANLTMLEDSSESQWLVLLEDVTERVLAEREIQAARDSLSFQKSLLESQGEALVDGLLVVGTTGEMISFNRKFVEMWDIPREVIDTRSDQAAINSVLGKLVDPESFLERIAHLYEHPLEESHDELQLIDGRVVERFSAPVRGAEGHLFGRMWFFRDITQTRRREQTLALLAAATEAASSTRTVGENLRRIANLMVERVADVCIIYLVDEDGVVDRTELADRDPKRERYLREAVGPITIDPSKVAGVSKVLTEGKPILASHADAEMMAEDVTDPQALLEIIGPIGIQSWICVPLTANRRSIGAMSLVSLTRTKLFEDADLKLAMGVARRVSLGIAMVRVAERERGIAESLQRSLLPQRLPNVPGLIVSSHYAAGSKGMDVGGDWLELVELSGKKVLAVIGDVAGKGLRAAAVMGEIRTALRAYSMETSSPSEMVNRLNRLLLEDEDFRMATVLCAVIDLRQYKVCFVTAGHPPPLLLDPEGEARFLSGGLNPPLGVPLHLHQEVEYEFPPGSTLVLYTDGVVERRDRHIDEGLDQMKRLIESTAPNPSALCAEIVAAATDQQESSDDVAVLAVQMAPVVPEILDLDIPAAAKELERVRSTVERWLISHRASGEVIEDVVLAVNEACANAVEHAYAPGQGAFRVLGSVESGKVKVEIMDQGIWREAVPSEQGRGLSVMNAVMDEVFIERTSKGTLVKMVRDLKTPSASSSWSAEPAVPRERIETRVSLSGEIDLSRAKGLTVELLSHITNDMKGLVLNLSDVTYIDSSGVRMLFVLHERLRERRQGMRIVVPEGSPLRRMLELAAVPSVIEVVASESQ